MRPGFLTSAAESFNTLSLAQLRPFESELHAIFDKITLFVKEQRFFNEAYDISQINSRIRLAFNIKRFLETEYGVVPQHAQLLVVDKLHEVEKNELLYPNEQDTAKILELDKSNQPIQVDLADLEKSYNTMKQNMAQQGMERFLMPFEAYKAGFEVSDVVKQKDKTFHYLPYNFSQSRFELASLRQILDLANFRAKQLEIYYNGERGLTEFVINCFAQQGQYWQNIGRYTPDFLLIQRNQVSEIHKVLIVETIGTVFSHDPVFQQKKQFVETEFLRQNNEKFGYQRFDFLCIEEDQNLTKLICNKINHFF
jgi:hypothetical protein